ncbi:MAG: hypothetical protein VKP72_08220 [bacterium]|nr:hypothetical protein [bacterium]
MTLARPTRNRPEARLPQGPALMKWLALGLVVWLAGCPEEVSEEILEEATPRPRSSALTGSVTGGSPRPSGSPTVSGSPTASASPQDGSSPAAGSSGAPSDGASPVVLKTPPPGGSGAGGGISGDLPTPTPTVPAATDTPAPTPEPTLAPIVKPVDGGSTLPSASPEPVPSTPVGGSF